MNHIVKRFVIPIAGLRVINPATSQPLQITGDHVIGHAEYWVRRISDGDVTLGEPPAITEGRAASERSKPATASASKE